MNYNIAERLRNTLSNMGYPVDANQFDAHSTIEISFTNIPSLFFSVIDDRLWLWSALTWMDSSTFSSWGAELWEELQEALCWVVTGQPVLGLGSEGYELKALVDDLCFDEESRLEELLEGFYVLCLRLNERFSQSR
ncbi:type III secretion apparatus InvB [Rouxiella chamberiensis]|uniref:Type III secretion apparatus InvB n=1 Tax=Rouxiella chamberiensis TaxID=1513468 RepID=A0ABY7HR39_9GAMM|nr:type III secretion apparatus InvB [Rouxiella chamberiensis]WAT01316.1 type III secretion apparatus InvB [Rouxiella chamberiensis]